MAVTQRSLLPLAIFLSLILSLPAMEQHLNVIDSGVLKGVTNADTQVVPLTLTSWLDGTFQETKTREVQQGLGFREDFIRLYNQLQYDLFKESSSASIVVGKNGNLFESGYLDGYWGKDFSGKEVIRERVRKMKFIQDTLARLGKKFVFVYAPSKARAMSYDLPDPLFGKNKVPDLTNYNTYLSEGKAAGLCQIDFNGWFVELQKTAKHPVFAREGIHWTTYGALLAADSFYRFMQPDQELKFPIRWSDQNLGSKPTDQENDIAQMMNLIAYDSKTSFFHPEIFYSDNKEEKPTAVYISDSFMWTWIYLKLPQNINKSYQFWSYYHQVFDPQRPELKTLDDIDRFKEVMAADWVVVMNTECNFSKPGGNFPEDFYRYLGGK